MVVVWKYILSKGEMLQRNEVVEVVGLDDEMSSTKKFPNFTKCNSLAANFHDSNALFISCIPVRRDACQLMTYILGCMLTASTDLMRIQNVYWHSIKAHMWFFWAEFLIIASFGLQIMSQDVIGTAGKHFHYSSYLCSAFWFSNLFFIVTAASFSFFPFLIQFGDVAQSTIFQLSSEPVMDQFFTFPKEEKCCSESAFPIDANEETFVVARSGE